MKINLKREMFDARLPAAACTQEMLTAIKELAKKEDTSESAIIRAGVALILSMNSSKSSK